MTIPKQLREQLGFLPGTQVEFRVVHGSILVERITKKPDFAKWKGFCGDRFAQLGYSWADQFIEDIRGR